MKNNKYDWLKSEEKIKWFFREKLNRLGSKYPRLVSALVVLHLFLGLGLVSFVATFAILIYQEGKRKEPTTLPAHTEDLPQQNSIENPLERRIYDEKYSALCEGAEFDIVDELTEVGGERFIFPLKEDDHVASVSGELLYQGSYKTLWECSPPYIVKVEAVSISGPSVGLFLESENVYKITVGDGDRINLKIQRNDLGYRGEWETLLRDKLTEPIAEKEKVKLEIEEVLVGEWVELSIRVSHSGKDAPDEFSARFIPHPGIEGDSSRGFRVGINDSRYKGEGSLVRLETLSITEIDN